METETTEDEVKELENGQLHLNGDPCGPQNPDEILAQKVEDFCCTLCCVLTNEIRVYDWSVPNFCMKTLSY